MKTITTKKTLDQYVNDFSKHVNDAVKSITNAAKVYVDALKVYPEKAQRAFEKRYPHVSTKTWAKFRAVGHGDVNPCIMFFSDKFAAQIMRMPKARQDEVLNGDSFEVFNPTTRHVERVTYGEIRPRHERLLFDDNKTAFRDVNAQKDYADLLAAAKKKTYSPYAVKGGNLEVYTACTITKGEVEDILEEMEK